MTNPYLPQTAEVIERIQETPTIFTLRLRFSDKQMHDKYRFAPGQFNMLYLQGIGEIPLSIVSDPADEMLFDHTIRVVGRVTKGLSQLGQGDKIGVRGPFGRGWPLKESLGKDIVLVTGGLGCAPVVSVIRYVTRRRDLFERLVIMQGVKRADDLIWADQYAQWAKLRDTQVILAASEEIKARYPWHTGHVTNLMHKATFNPANAIAMMCGPEPMMRAAIEALIHKGLSENRLWLSMERNMQCAVGHCGHCQYGEKFICKDGPVFPYSEIKPYFGINGY
ncbi:MAG TPA: Ni/Fe hydrogenase subunit gamma [Gammaproteobacteria bacterium]|nr:Ni/Fe hydrogenase subunit gamma [Gammaproteobacteria bacterium]